MVLRFFPILLCSLIVYPIVSLAEDARVYVQADANMPLYQIGPIQIDASRKRQATPEVIVQWRMVRRGIGSPTVRAITGNKNMILILAGVSGNPSGTLRFDYEGSTREPAAVAVWFEINRVRMPTSLISNVSTFGKLDPKRLPRFADADALAKFDEKDKRLPPKILPKGYVPLLSNYPILPGMTGKAAHENKWFDAEILAIDSKRWLTVKFDDPDGSIRLLPTLPSGDTSFFVVRPNTLSAARNNPRRFQASLNVLPGTIAEIPEGYVSPTGARLPPGLPVKFAFANGWRDGFVLREDRQQVEIQTRFAGRTDQRKVDRSSIIVTAADAKTLKKRNAARTFKENLQGAALER